MNSLTKKLIDFGLSEKEAKVYLATLELEVATVNEIAKQSGINRSSTYVVLEGLKKRGLVGISDDKSIRRYVAASPDTLLHSAQSAAKKQEDIKSNIESIIPELKALHKDTKRKPKVRVFEGKSGVIETIESSLNSEEKLMRVCSSHENWLKSHSDFREYFEDYIKRRIKLGIKMKGVHPDSSINRNLAKLDPAQFDELLFIPKDKYLFPAEIAIYDDKIGYISPELDGFSIIIEHKEVADMMKKIFDLAWEEAKRLNKNPASK